MRGHYVNLKLIYFKLKYNNKIITEDQHNKIEKVTHKFYYYGLYDLYCNLSFIIHISRINIYVNENYNKLV